MVTEDPPWLLDWFSGPGGAARGYHDAGFNVVGVDIERQPNYPYEFYKADVFTQGIKLAESGQFQAIHASPPCQAFSPLTPSEYKNDHPKLIGILRDILNSTGLPWAMENVPQSDLDDSLMLCGTMFDLGIRRHRHFEFSDSLFVPQPGPCRHHTGMLIFNHSDETEYKEAMGINWMGNKASRQCIPPAYTEHIGNYLLKAI